MKKKNILPQITAGLFLWLCTCHVSAAVSCAAVSATPPPSQLPEDEQFNSCFLSEDISSVPSETILPKQRLNCRQASRVTLGKGRIDDRKRASGRTKFMDGKSDVTKLMLKNKTYTMLI